MLAPVAFDPALDDLEQVCPHRLRTEISAPNPSGDRVHQEQGHRGEDEQAGEVVNLLRPQLDEEEIEAPSRKIDQHRLIGRIGAAIPTHEWQAVIDAERHKKDDPFDRAISPLHALRINLPARNVKRPFIVASRFDRGFRLLNEMRERRHFTGGLQLRVGRDGGRKMHGQSLLSPAQRVDVNRERLDRALIKPANPGRHDAAAPVP